MHDRSLAAHHRGRPRSVIASTLVVAAVAAAFLNHAAEAERFEPTRDPITVVVTTDQPSYPLGAPIEVEAVATYGDGSPVGDVRSARVKISDASGRPVDRSDLVPRGNGRFTYTSTVPGSGTPGTWEAEVKITDMSNRRGEQEASFSVTGSPGGCPDADGDGHQGDWCGGDDCNDGDPTIHPGALEVCGDGIDQDCDGADSACECEDFDEDGFEAEWCGGTDCNDGDPTINPGAEEICGDGIDQDCDGADLPCPCDDLDGDGYDDAACGGDDCDDADSTIHPGAPEVCGDDIDQDCDGVDLPCGAPHSALTWNGPGTCLACHTAEAHEVHASVMYQWEGATPDMDHGPALQGKISGAVNSYCINILGNWNACGTCHVGLGGPPEPGVSQQQLENIDCMICHQQEYRRKKVDGAFVPDEAAMTISMDEAARTVHRPERFNCLQCHANAGGGDSVKRGDLTLAHVATSDRVFDVHMSTAGGNMRCQQCHTFSEHRVAGKGSDLRPTDSPVSLECSNCHAGMANGDHEGSFIDRHTARVACQTCHIPLYAKDASDTSASEATELHRTWLSTHSSQPPYHPASEKRNDVMPEYRFWNRMSRNYLLGDDAVIDPSTGRYPTSRPLGTINDVDSKLYAFKYKTATQPITLSSPQKLIPLDTAVFFATASASAATEAGLANMGLPPATPYEWVETDTFQMLNHEVSPSDLALDCNDCHGSSARMDLQGRLGYAPKDSLSVLCVQCHGWKSPKGFIEDHDKHVKDKRKDCSWCHSFSRPERGLQMPR